MNYEIYKKKLNSLISVKKKTPNCPLQLKLPRIMSLQAYNEMLQQKQLYICQICNTRSLLAVSPRQYPLSAIEQNTFSSFVLRTDKLKATYK